MKKLSKIMSMLTIAALALGFIYLAVGFIYFRFFDPAPPECPLPPLLFYVPLAPLYDFPYSFGHLDPIAEVKDIKLEFTIPETVFELGEKILVEMWLTNTGNGPIRIYYGDPLAWVVFEDERGLKWISARMFKGILLSAELEPNEPYPGRKERIILQADPPIVGLLPRYTLEPGTYTLHVFAYIAIPDGDGTKRVFTIHASPIQIEIRESTSEEREVKRQNLTPNGL